MHPLTKFGIKGLFWWQGEHNASDDVTNYWALKNAGYYKDVLPRFIKAMREKCVHSTPDFPVLVMQLHPYGSQSTKVGQSDIAMVRSAQYLAAVQLPNVGFSVSHDITATGTDIYHPRNREPYAMRAAKVALGKWYEQGSAWQFSGFTKVSASGNAATIDFTPGFKLSTKDSLAPKMFTVAG